MNDTAHKRTVLFGGIHSLNIGDYELNDTWEWDGVSWAKRTTMTSPPGRYLHAMAYDSARGVTVLFGGYAFTAGETVFGDTWEWDGQTWTQRNSPSNPSVRYGHAMCFDVNRGVTVLFGGLCDNGAGIVRCGDTWEWDGTSWTQRMPLVSPDARYRPAMAYDTARGVSVLFSGNGSDHPNDTWEWDGLSWVRRITSSGPVGRRSHSMIFDASRGVIVLFGGRNYDSVYNDTWEWNGAAWTQLDTISYPLERFSHSLSYDPLRKAVVLIGGFDGVAFDDQWELNDSVWKPTFPMPRTGHAAVFDAAREVVVQFGGGDQFGPSDETWEWDGIRWILRNPVSRPLPRHVHAMAYDSARGVTVLFGGKGATEEELRDTWEWNGLDWNQRSPSKSPPFQYYHAMAFDSVRGVTVMFGGWNDDDQTWEWDGSNWTGHATKNRPPARWASAMAFDRSRGVTVLFGGHNGNTLDDTWEWDGTNWTQRSSQSIPISRYLHQIAFDDFRNVIVLFGGEHPGSGNPDLGDTWEWDGAAWTQCAIPSSPPSRARHAMAFDSARGEIVVHGGYSHSNPLFRGDTWRLSQTNPMPSISQSPASPHVCENSVISLHVDATGEGTLTYQWQKNGAALADDEDTFGTQLNTLVFAHAQPSDTGHYDCVVKLNDCTQTTSNAAILTVYPTGSGDGNGDKLADSRDIQSFIDALINHDPVGSSLCAFDFTAEGQVDLADIPGFTQKLLGL